MLGPKSKWIEGLSARALKHSPSSDTIATAPLASAAAAFTHSFKHSGKKMANFFYIGGEDLEQVTKHHRIFVHNIGMGVGQLVGFCIPARMTSAAAATAAVRPHKFRKFFVHLLAVI